MVDYLHLLSFGLGTFILGGALAVGFLCKVAGRNSEWDTGEGCFGVLIAITGMVASSPFLLYALS